MLKSRKIKIKKLIILVVALIFVFSNFYAVFFFKLEEVKATPVTNPDLVPLSTAENVMKGAHMSQQAAEETEKKVDRIITKILSEIKAMFFKNILGGLANTIAQQTAVWVAHSDKGGAPKFITNFDQFIQGYADAAIGDMIQTVMQDLTGIDICTLDPRIAIDLTLDMPMFPGFKGYSPDCSFSELTSHWEEWAESDWFSFNYQIQEGGTVSESNERLRNFTLYDEQLMIWDNRLMDWLPGNCESISGGRVKCSMPPVQENLQVYAEKLDDLTETLSDDSRAIRGGMASSEPVELSVGEFVIAPENIPLIKEEWFNRIDPWLENLQEAKSVYSGCKGKSAIELREGDCARVLQGLGIGPVLGTIPEDARNLAEIYENEVNRKIGLIEGVIDSIKSSFDYLKSSLDRLLTPENFEAGERYNWQLGKGMFNPEANEFNAWENIAKEIVDVGLDKFIDRHVEATINDGWKGAMDRITDTIQTPANLIRDSVEEDLKASKGVYNARIYTKEIAADALGVFTGTLWNHMIKRLLTALNESQQEEYSVAKLKKQAADEAESEPLDPVQPFNVFSQEVVTSEGIQSYVEKLAQQFSYSATYKSVNLLSDFQLELKGEVNPNIYNNVIDSNFALAINDKLTISEALEKRKLVGDYGFSWGETVETGTYHLANIKKLRKARVVPLGLELAIELVRDCNFRNIYDEDNDGQPDFAKFEDITAQQPGYNDLAKPFVAERLRNCLFKPSGVGASLEEIRNYNIRKKNEVVGATLADVVNGFDKIGSGTCGDFDDDESAFCNLVDPDWLLKIPTTKCALQTDLEPYGEILMSNLTGQRYSRCPDFSSCLEEDGKGGCVNEDYGFCVKEKNAWQFGADSCPEAYNSCRTYTISEPEGTSLISYLKNTLSGSEICGPHNAGCSWYATNRSKAGLWQDDQRIYLNNNVESCQKENEGCNEFFLYRDSANNLVADSSFEYTKEGYFPANWDLRLKKEVEERDECDGTYYESCLNYGYETRELCNFNNGTWQGFCDGVEDAVTEEECLAREGTWDYRCEGAVNDDVKEDDCSNDKLGIDAEYKKYCLTSILKYNLCRNPQFDNQADCEDNNGTWQTECQIDGQISSELTEAGEETCVQNGGSWLKSCQDAFIYDYSKENCQELLGDWLGYGPFSDIASVSKDGFNVHRGLGKLQVDISQIPADQELQLVHSLKFNEDGNLTRAGDTYTATAYLKSNQPLDQPIIFNLVKKIKTFPDELNSGSFSLNNAYSRVNSTLMTSRPGTALEILINLPGGETDAEVYLDALDLSLNTIDQVRNRDFISGYTDYESNNKIYYKKPPEILNCHGYGPGDPPPVMANFTTKKACEDNGYFWDQPEDDKPAFFADKTACYKYAPDDSACINYMKVCQPEEVGCQLFTPLNNDPPIPGVVSTYDYCPAECVGYDTYKQESALYDPEPDPLYHYFIPDTASACTLDEVGCSQFTNLDEVARGGEGIGYYTYLRQCIKPNLGLGEKTYFTWQGSETGPPQLIKYELQQDENTGAPKTIDGSADCRVTLGSQDFKCINFFDNDGNNYWRNIRKTVSVSEDCHPYRKTDATEENCEATNGRWQSDIEACLYDAIPDEGIACRPEANGCRAFVGNQGNNVYIKMFDNFEDTAELDWYNGLEGEENDSLTRVGESIAVGGHSLLIPQQEVNSIHKFIDIQRGNLYTLSFWAKTDNPAGEVIAVRFSTAVDDGNATTMENFATLENQTVRLTTDWQNYTLGPVYVSWDDLQNNSLIFDSLDNKVYLDNILLKVVKDNVYAIKDSWSTPDSCDRTFYGVFKKGEMIGCQAYEDILGQTHYLRSFTNLCRESAVGCQILVDTKNSVNPHGQTFNNENASPLDDYSVAEDELTTLVLNDNYSCSDNDKGCQRLGKPNFEDVENITFQEVYLKNNPDKYVNVPDAILCNHDALGCTELINEEGVSEYYKIEPTKLCEYKQNLINGQKVEGWFKKGNPKLGCGGLLFDNIEDCQDNGGEWSEKYDQCTLILPEIKDEETCLLKRGEWLNSQCLAYPFSIYKVYEANKYKGYVGKCSEEWNGCTEFLDINPNFVFNGGFETRDPTGGLSNWVTVAASSGSQDKEIDDVQAGETAIKLIKETAQDCPSTPLYEECEAPPYGISQKLVRLEKGKAYKISFYYKMNEDSKGVGNDCPMPEAAFEFRPVDSERGAEPIIYTAETDWKKVEILYSVPLGECENSDYKSQKSCEEEDLTWNEFDDLLDFNLILYAPLNGNKSAEKNNCPDSYIIYDQVEVKDNTEDSYYVIDLGVNVDRSSCTEVDWNNGCVEFLNTANNNFETIKVSKDRNCEQWAVCTEKDENGFCQQVNLCAEREASECVRLLTEWQGGELVRAPKDNVRYSLQEEPMTIKRISDYNNKEGYIYRFGIGPLTQLTQWRAGDYSGYTIPNRFPLETELNDKEFEQYFHLNKLGRTADERYTEAICKIFPEQNAPLPYQLSEEQEYKDIPNLYSQSVDLKDIGTACSYEQVKAGGYTTYFPLGDSPAKICTMPEEAKGQVCSKASDCNPYYDPDNPEELANCKDIENRKAIFGLEGMCLEFDTSNPLYDGIYQDFYETTSDYQPYACLTYYPFLIDTCAYYKDETECENKIGCSWNGDVCKHEGNSSPEGGASSP